MRIIDAPRLVSVKPPVSGLRFTEWLDPYCGHTSSVAS